ncbi:MAG: hypothetical protein EOM20_15995 [Spartobacteria bacterium]|nr:hypothetical protein [Spartobacteria bacterium]
MKKHEMRLGAIQWALLTNIQFVLSLLIALQVVAISFESYASNVVSRPVGIVRLQVDPGSSRLCSLPFYAFDPSIQALLQGQLVGATSSVTGDGIRKWDVAGQCYVSAFKADQMRTPVRKCRNLAGLKM